MLKIKYVIKYFAKALKQPKIKSERKCKCNGADNNNNRKKCHSLLPR